MTHLNNGWQRFDKRLKLWYTIVNRCQHNIIWFSLLLTDLVLEWVEHIQTKSRMHHKTYRWKPSPKMLLETWNTTVSCCLEIDSWIYDAKNTSRTNVILIFISIYYLSRNQRLFLFRLKHVCRCCDVDCVDNYSWVKFSYNQFNKPNLWILMESNFVL